VLVAVTVPSIVVRKVSDRLQVSSLLSRTDPAVSSNVSTAPGGVGGGMLPGATGKFIPFKVWRV